MLSWLRKGEQALREELDADMANEMVLLGIVRRHHPELLGVLPVAPHAQLRPPTLRRKYRPWSDPPSRLVEALVPKVLDGIPAEDLSNNLQAIECLFDPAFWGQYAGGTPHGDGPGFSASHHWIGHDLHSGRYSIEWSRDGEGRRVPEVVSDGHAPARWPLFNLHVHSKKISEFI
jgi:hypothetical protein